MQELVEILIRKQQRLGCISPIKNPNYLILTKKLINFFYVTGTVCKLILYHKTRLEKNVENIKRYNLDITDTEN